MFFVALRNSFNEFDKNWEHLSKYLHQYDETLPETKEQEIAKRIRNFYFSNGEAFDESQMEQLTKVKCIL